jgi:hypothetical protein
MNRTILAALLAAPVALATLSACYGSDSAASATAPNAQCAAEGPVVVAGQALTGEAIGKAMIPACGSCHAAGTSRPFFASGKAFEDLILRSPTYVTPGKPEESDFYRLLIGTGTHAYKQMPPSGPTYADLAKAGGSTVSADQIRDFIAALSPASVAKGGNVYANEKATTMRRVSARQIQASLTRQLGLTAEDFAAHPEFLPLVDPDRGGLPAERPNAGPPIGDYNGAFAVERWHALGGGQTTDSRQADKNAGGQMMMTINQMAQGWCRLSVGKPGSPLFKYATKTDTSKTAAANVQKNLGYLYAIMLGLPEKPAETAQLYALFQTYEPKGSETAWTAVCSALVRHPLWITY